MKRNLVACYLLDNNPQTNYHTNLDCANTSLAAISAHEVVRVRLVRTLLRHARHHNNCSPCVANYLNNRKHTFFKMNKDSCIAKVYKVNICSLNPWLLNQSQKLMIHSVVVFHNNCFQFILLTSTPFFSVQAIDIFKQISLI